MAKDTIIIRGGRGVARPVDSAPAEPERIVETPRESAPETTRAADVRAPLPPVQDRAAEVRREPPLQLDREPRRTSDVRYEADHVETAPAKRRNGLLPLVAGALVLALLGAGLGLLFTRDDEPATAAGRTETAAAQPGAADLGLSSDAETPADNVEAEAPISITEAEPSEQADTVVAPAPAAAPPAPATAPRTADDRPTPTPAPAAERRPAAAPARPPVVRASTSSARPSFNCRYARSQSERLVCSDPVLAAADWRLHNVFERAMADADNPRALRAEQDRWLQAREAAAPDNGAVLAAYEARIDELAGR